MDEQVSTLDATGANRIASPLLLRAHEAAALCGKSERTWRSWNATGLIPRPIRIGHSTLWRIGELKAWVDAGCPDRVLWEAMQKS